MNRRTAGLRWTLAPCTGIVGGAIMARVTKRKVPGPWLLTAG
jgi:hypothetical protein